MSNTLGYLSSILKNSKQLLARCYVLG